MKIGVLGRPYGAQRKLDEVGHWIGMANCIKTLGAYYGRPTWFEKVFPSSRPWSVRTVAPPKLTLGTDLKTKFVTMTVLTVAAFVYIIFMLIYLKIVRLL
jgi:hypothetical protein